MVCGGGTVWAYVVALLLPNELTWEFNLSKCQRLRDKIGRGLPALESCRGSTRMNAG